MAKKTTSSRNSIAPKITTTPTRSPFDKVAEIIGLMGDAGLAELDLESRELKVRLRRNAAPVAFSGAVMASPPMPVPMMATMMPSASEMPSGTSGSLSVTPAPVKKAEPTYHHVVSPIAGTYYQAPSPSSPPFVKEGDMIAVGQTLCIIEAMKQMNEIKSDSEGRVMKALLANSTPVDKGTVLFWVDKKK